MTQHSHQTAPPQFVEANGIRFAYRRFGNAAGVPLVFHQHFTGTMDHWDPAVTDGLARGREVVLFNNAGVSSRSGEVPTSFEQMGRNAVALIKALGLQQVDVLGFSIGGFVAQEITLAQPKLPDPTRYWTAQWRGDGWRYAGRQPDLRSDVRGTRSPLAQRFLHAVASKSGGGPRVPETLSASHQRSRSRSERKGSPGTARGHRQVGRSARVSLRLSDGYPTANAGRERQQ